MAKNTKTINITIKASKDAFTSFFRHLKGEKEKEFDFSEISALRQLLNNEKARILHVIKHEKPSSLYALAKILKRDFKSVQQDVKLLEHFPFFVSTNCSLITICPVSFVLLITSMLNSYPFR